MVSKDCPVPKAKLACYEKLIATRAGLVVKGAMNPYSSMKGNMANFLTKTSALALRLSAADRAEFMQKHRARECVQYGTVMKEYALVPETVWAKPALWRKYFAASCDYVAGLKAKATTRKKKAAKKSPAKRPPSRRQD
ncbi:MAG TPA: hypothetical protein VGC54_03080 [Planctomycetota bacterium]